MSTITKINVGGVDYDICNPEIVKAPVESSTVVTKGDMLYMNGSCVVHTASELSFGSSLAATQSIFRSQFLGIAMQDKAAGTEEEIDVAITGTFEMGCDPSSYFLFGTLVGPDYNNSNSCLDNQKVVEVENTRCAIGRIAKQDKDANVAVVRICSTIFAGGLAIDSLPVE